MDDLEQQASAEEPVEDSTESQQDSSQSAETKELTDEEILSTPAVQRMLQSMKDKEAARIERKYREQVSAAQRRLAEEAEEEELERLEADGAFDDIGRRAVESKRLAKIQREAYGQAANDVTAFIREKLFSRQEIQSLGKETLDSLINTVEEEGGSIVELIPAIFNAIREKEVKEQVEEVRASLLKEVDAKLLEAGLTKRSESAASGNAPSPSVERGGTVPARTSASDDEYVARFAETGEGDPDKVRAILTKQGVL